MKQTAKKLLSLLLAVLMLLSCGVCLLDGSVSVLPVAKAAGISQYSALAAVDWAKNHVYDRNSVLVGKGYYSDGGDCANFVSQCIYMGGLDMTSKWNSAGHMCMDPYTWINAHQLYRYVVSLGGTSVNDPSASEVSIGDLIFYKTRSDGKMHHSAIVIDIKNGNPVIAAHSDNSRPMYTETNWRLGYKGSRIYLVKMNGAPCVAPNPRSFDVYTAKSYTNLYKYASSTSRVLKGLIRGSYIHVTETKTVKGVKYGKTSAYGYTGWVKLSQMNYQSHRESYQPSHDMGDWYTISYATCVSTGKEERKCNRCSYTETRTTNAGGHKVTNAASCINASYCDLCGTKVSDPLGHSLGNWTTYKAATCTASGTEKRYCSRCSYSESRTTSPLGHNYDGSVSSAPNCTQNGVATYKCTRCGNTYTKLSNSSNAWSEWMTDNKTSTIPSDRIQTKTQYRYKDYQTTTSYSASMSGWTRGSYTLVKDSSKSGSVRFAPEWHNGFDTSNSLYKTYKKADGSVTAGVPTNFLDYDGQTVVDNDTTKVVIDKDYVVGYIYWHWCRNDHKNTDEHIEWYSGTYDGNSYTTFHAFYKDGTDYDYVDKAYAFKYSNTSVCDSTYWWNGRERTEIGESEKAIYVKQQDYTTYKKNYTYSRWTDWSSWSDTAVTASSTRKVETRTLYRYNLLALGHNFTVDASYANTCTTPGFTGKKCSRCGALDPNGKTVAAHGHNIPNWNTQRNKWYKISDNGTTVVYRADCTYNCGYFETRTEAGCQYKQNKVVSPTCTEKGYTEMKCATHGETMKTNYTNALGHAYDTSLPNSGWIVDSAPTCEKQGSMHRDCIRKAKCGYTETKVIDAVGHTYVHHDAVLPDCVNDGMKEYYECSVCHKIFDASKNETTKEKLIDPAKGHTPGEWVRVSEPGCGITGYEEQHCTVCDTLLDEREIPGWEHNYVVTEEKESTCETIGYTVYTCTECGDKISEFKDPKDHTWGDWVVEDAVCIYDGQKTRICTVCGETDYEIIDAKYTEHNLKKVTSSDGCIAYECTRCDYKEDGSHYFIRNTAEDIAATCETNGRTAYICSTCSTKKYEETPCLDHDYKEASVTAPTCTESGYVTMVCSRDSSHTYKKYTEQPLGHNVVTDEVVEPKCIETGLTVGYHCDRCGEVFTAQTVVDELGHDYSEWVDNNDNATHTKTCLRESCKDYIVGHTVTENHNMAESDRLDATCLEKGFVEYTCTDCGYSYTIELNATGHDWGEWFISVNETCTEKGENKRICKNDATHIETTERDALGHDMGEWYTDKAPDYGVEGVSRRDCQRENCEYYETKPIPALVKNKYTATFVVKNDDGTEETVGTVVFEEGTKSISEPEVPEKKNFVGRWNDYELNDEDITIYATYEKINTDPEEIEVKKEAKNDNGKAVITLTASSGSRTVMFNSKSTKALDVILVLDQSGSMADNGKKDKLVNCAKDFVNKLYENGKATGADHRIALVGFACAEIEQAGYYNYQNTKILAANNSTDGYQYKNGGLTDSQYADALMPVVVDGQLNGIIANSITTEKIKAYGATAADLGLEMAKGILSSTDTSADRERIVVFITDGTPTYSSEQSSSDVKKPAKDAIETAKEIKNDLDTDVYSVLIGVKDDEINIGSGRNTEKFSRKTFMNAVSSNYPGAVSMDNIGSDTTDKGYYFNATDTSAFDNIFKNVLYSSVYKTVNFSKVSFFDTLSSDITLTIEDEAKMREDIIAQYGISNNDIIVARNSDGTTYLEFRNIPVKNVFDADGKLSYCASVTFRASLNENAVNEGTYETNTDNAGVKIGDDTVAKFDVPTVTVTPARNIVVFKINGVTYSITDGEQGDVIEAPVTELGTWNIPEGTTITSSCAVFEAEVSEQKYLVTWFVGDKNVTEEYSIGEKITVPEGLTAPDGMEITGWSPAVNCYCMGENIAYTAILAETHTHKYVQYKITGSCEEGCTVYLRCELCNDEITQQKAPAAHKLKTRVNADDTNTIEGVYCTVCHKSKDMRLVVEKAPNKRQNPWQTVYNFNLTQNNIETQPGDKMLIRIELTDEQLKKDFNVYRVDEDGTKTLVSSYKEDGYLVIEADHFCYYVLSELDENGNELAPVSYDTAMCAFNKHKFTNAVTTAPTCLETGVRTYTCSNCGTFYTEEVEATGHTDRDNDNYCDDCGAEINHIDCTHICHSTNKFMQFIWKILNFFNKIFKMDEKCECGKMHW